MVLKNDISVNYKAAFLLQELEGIENDAYDSRVTKQREPLDYGEREKVRLVLIDELVAAASHGTLHPTEAELPEANLQAGAWEQVKHDGHLHTAQPPNVQTMAIRAGQAQIPRLTIIAKTPLLTADASGVLVSVPVPNVYRNSRPKVVGSTSNPAPAPTARLESNLLVKDFVSKVIDP